MRKIISMISILANCALNVIAQNLVIERQGHFSVGGSVIQHEGVYDNSKFVGWATQVEKGQKARLSNSSQSSSYTSCICAWVWRFWRMLGDDSRW